MTTLGENPVTVEIGTFPMPFRIVFKHTSAAREATENVIVRLTHNDGTTGYGEGCPRSYVTGETTASALDFLAEWAPKLVAEVNDLEGLRKWVLHHRVTIDDNPAAFCALELAALDLLARRDGLPVPALLGLAPARSGIRNGAAFRYSAVLGDSAALTYAAQLLRYRVGGLRHYKLKLSGDLDRDRSKIRWFRGRLGSFMAQTVRVDANNLWSEPAAAIDHLTSLGYPLLGVEEPLAANDLEGFLTIAEAIDSKTILDESLLRRGQVADLPGNPARWILNCRISKSGGLLRSLELIATARSAGLGIIVGAHVGETSLLTSAALIGATAAGTSLVAQEGAFGSNLLTTDICDEPIMFGRGGLLGAEQLRALGPTGLGVDVIDRRLSDLRPVG